MSRLAALFQHEVGTGIAQYRDRMRMERAAQLLRASCEPVARIAAAVGYDNPFHFSSRFKAITGRSPRAYRQQAG
jgi:AraC-like DNA-binding protein